MKAKEESESNYLGLRFKTDWVNELQVENRLLREQIEMLKIKMTDSAASQERLKTRNKKLKDNIATLKLNVYA